jgi:hypothetical protein
MPLRTLSLLLTIGLIFLFAAVNWQAFNTPSELSLVLTTVTAPLGLIMLGLSAVVALLGLLALASLKSRALIESHQLGKENQALRKLADQAEASRLLALEQMLAAKLGTLSELNNATRTTLLARLDEFDASLRSSFEQHANSLAACIGELEDRIDSNARDKRGARDAPK